MNTHALTQHVSDSNGFKVKKPQRTFLLFASLPKTFFLHEMDRSRSGCEHKRLAGVS